jgi:hypothetical protein
MQSLAAVPDTAGFPHPGLKPPTDRGWFKSLNPTNFVAWLPT